MSFRCSLVQIIKLELLKGVRGCSGISLKARLLPTNASTSRKPMCTLSCPKTFLASSFESTSIEIERSLLSGCFLVAEEGFKHWLRFLEESDATLVGVDAKSFPSSDFLLFAHS